MEDTDDPNKVMVGAHQWRKRDKTDSSLDSLGGGRVGLSLGIQGWRVMMDKIDKGFSGSLGG